MMRFRVRLGAAVTLVASLGVVLALSACTTFGPAAPTSTASVQRALPRGVTLTVFQNRSDFAPRHLQVEVSNGSAGSITLRSGSFSSAFFASAAPIGSLPYALDPGDQVSFPVVLPKPACSASAAHPRVSLSFTDAQGRGSATVSPTVLYNALHEINVEDCARYTFEQVVRITPGSSVKTVRLPNKNLVGELAFTFTPTGAAGSVTIKQIDATTLLDMSFNTRLPLVMTAKSAPVTLILTVSPTRCETHVLSEDKVGTVVPFHVVTPSTSNGYFGLVLSDTLKFEFYHYFSAACGYPG
jgi:hypothetical protein